MLILRWALILAAAAVAAAVLGFYGPIGSVTGPARVLFLVFLAGLAALVFAGLLSHRRAIAREARSAQPRGFTGPADVVRRV